MKRTLWIMAIAAVTCVNQAYAAKLIKVDGSSTVFPITEAVAEEFQIAKPSFLFTAAK